MTEQIAATRAFATMLRAARLMVHAKSEDQLIRTMCDLIAREEIYAFAWYGVPVDDANRSVRVVAKGGEDHGYVDNIKTSWGEGPLAQGPTGMALRTGATQVRVDLAHDERFAPWRDAALGIGLASSIALPVSVDGQIHGALMVYSSELAAFDGMSRELMEGLAADLGTAIEHFRATERLARSEARYRMLAENAMDLVAELNAAGDIEWVSPSVTTVIGYQPQELIGTPAKRLFASNVERAFSPTRDETTMRLLVRKADDTHLWMEVTIHPLTDAEGRVFGRVASARNIDEQVQAELALEHEVEFDSLTGLAMKRLTLQRVQEVLDTRRMQEWALLCVGVDGMTSINQAFTYAAGDAVLRHVAERLVEAAGAHDRVGRIAGDEFAIILRDLVTPEDAAQAAERFGQAVRGKVKFEDATLDVSACVGVALRNGDDAEALLRDATAAMRAAAQRSHDNWGFLDRDAADTSRRVLDIRARLREALAGDGIEPWFMGVHDLVTGELAGHEALARWRQPDGTVWAPDQFLPIAERSGLVVDLDRVMLRNALHVISQGAHNRYLGVNLSAATMRFVNLEEFVLGELRAYDVDPKYLSLEVTETELFDARASTLEQMRNLAKLGVQWWVDDFGTGYSSISHLRDLPLFGVKLDRSFTALLGEDNPRQASLVRGLAGLANGLGLSTIAEGVETAEHQLRLRELGWQLGQGYLFGAPARLS